MAHLSEDPGLVAAFASGADVHAATAAEVFGLTPRDGDARTAQRRQGDQLRADVRHERLRPGAQLGIGRGEAQDYIALYFSRFSGVRDYMERMRAQAREDGYVETVFGRRLYLPEIRSRNQAQRAGAERAAINAPMQGTAADIIKRAMVAVDAWLERREGARADADAGARRTGVRGRRGFVDGAAAQVKLAHGGRGGTARAAGGRYRRGRKLGRGALRSRPFVTAFSRK
jgi:DNA polymerase-1